MCPGPALPLMRNLQGMVKSAADFGTNFPWGVWMDATYWVKIKQWSLVKPKSGLGGTNRKVKNKQARFPKLFSFPLHCPLDSQLLWNYASPSEKLAHTAKANQIHSPFPKPFEISQLKANWEPHIPNGPLFPQHHDYNGNQNPFLEKL